MKKNRAHHFVFWLLLAAVLPLKTLAQNLVIDSNESVALMPYLQMWIPKQSVTFEEVLEADQQGLFRPLAAPAISVLERDVWYRFNYTDTTPYSYGLIVNFHELLYNDLELYEKIGNQWRSTKIDTDQSIASRPIMYRFFALPLIGDNNVEHTVYFRVNSFTHTLVYPHLETGRNFFSNAQNQTILSVAIIGILVGLTIYMWTASLALLNIPERIALMGLLLSNLLYVLYIDGHLTRLISGIEDSTRTLYILITASLSLFHLFYCRFYLKLKRLNPIAGFSCDIVILFIIFATTYSLIFANATAGQISIRTTGAAIIMTICASVIALVKRQPGANFYFIAILFFVLMAVYRLLVNSGSLDPSQYHRSFIYFGALSLAILLSLSITRQLSVSRAIQNQLEQKAREAEARDTSKGQFLATMGQEIRSPINGVIGMAQLLSESRLDSTQRDYIDVLLNSAKTLQNVVDDILDLSKVNANSLKLETVDFNLDQLLIYTVTAFSQTNQSKPIKFDLEEIHPLPFYLKGDPTRIQQVVSNMLRHSFATTERGAITLQVREIGSTSDTSTLRFSIHDSSTENFENSYEELFEPFAHLDNSPMFSDRGTVLGLAICKRLVELMQGEIGVNSVPGKGNEYWFTIKLGIDTQRQQQLEDSTSKLKNTSIAATFGNPLFSKGLVTYFAANDIAVIEHDYDLPLEEIKLDGTDLLLLSNAIGEASRNWLQAARMESTEVLMFNNIDNNVFPNTELREMGVGVINPPYGISQIIEVIGKLIAGTSGEPFKDIDISSAKHDLSNLRVLVAEDNLISTKVIDAILKSFKIDADFVVTGTDAVSYYESNGGQYDLILMDYQMPDLDGCGATVRIREIEHNKSWAPTIIYAITAYTSSDYKIRCMRAGMNGILTKPLQKALLVELLDSVNAKHLG